MVVAALFGWIWFKPAVDRMQKDLDDTKKELADLNKFTREVAVPALAENSELLRRVTEVLLRRRAS